MKHEFMEEKEMPKPHKVIVKFSDKKEETMLFFEPEVHIGYNLVTGQVGIYDESGNCLFLAHWSLVDYCLVVTDVMLKTN